VRPTAIFFLVSLTYSKSYAMISVIMKKDMRIIKESYGRIGDDEGRFDIEFWQHQGDQAIFNAALDMVLDYLMLRHEYVDKPRFQRTIESFGKA